MSTNFTYVESGQHKGVLHWRCEFNRDSTVMWIPVPYDDLLLKFSSPEHSSDIRRPSSKPVKRTYHKSTILYGSRLPLNMFVGLHTDAHTTLQQYVACNADTESLSAYMENTDKLLATAYGSVDISVPVSDRTLRRRIKSITGLSKTQLQTLLGLHDFLSTACGYGEKDVTLTNSISVLAYHDQPHFSKKFLKVFGSSPTAFLKTFDGLPEQLLTISYKYMADFHAIISKLQDKEI